MRIVYGNFETELKRITFQQSKSYKKLGGAMGCSIAHCLSLASKYCKDFQKAKYYLVVLSIGTFTSKVRLPKLANNLVVVEVYR